MRIKITVEQGGAVLSEAKVHIDSSRDLPAAVQAELENVPWQDRLAPLWGVVVKIDQPDAED
jgi:hypothetical protein